MLNNAKEFDAAIAAAEQWPQGTNTECWITGNPNIPPADCRITFRVQALIRGRVRCKRCPAVAVAAVRGFRGNNPIEDAIKDVALEAGYHHPDNGVTRYCNDLASNPKAIATKLRRAKKKYLALRKTGKPS